MPFPVRRPFFTRTLSAATLGVVTASLLVGVAWASTPTISLVAGTGTSGYNGDGIPAASAELNLPRALAVDTVGDVFVADTFNHRIRKIDTTGMITTVAGTGVAGSSGDGGPATKASMKWPHSVAVDKAGNLYITDSPNHRIRRVDHASGIITTIAGTGTSGYNGDGILATTARINDPKGVMVDDDGQGHVTVYIADSLNQRVRKVDPNGIITTIAGTGAAGYNGDGILAIKASLYRPRGMALDGTGNLYVADDDNHRVRRIDPSGVITTIAGTGVAGYNGDGILATTARLNNPRTLALDPIGNLYIADGSNSRIRRVDLSTGLITTVAGTGSTGYGGDGGPATSAKLNAARGVGLGPDGTLYIADTFNSRLRRVVGLPYSPVSSPPPVDNPPTAAVVGATTTAGTATPVTLTGSDVETCELGFSVVSAATHGTVSAPTDQACTPGSPNRDTATITYTPDAGFAGTDSFTYQVSDGTSTANATATVTVNPSGGGGGGGTTPGISFRSASFGQNPTSTTLTLPEPGGAVAGDVMVAAVGLRGSATITAPSGWTFVRLDNANYVLQAVYTRVVSIAEPASWTWTFSGSVAAAGGILDYAGVNTASPIDVHGGLATTTATTAITGPSITTTVNGDEIVGLFDIGGGNSITPPPGMTERGEAVSSAGSLHVTGEGCDSPQPSAGPTGTRTASATIAHPNIGQLIALRPA